jgi:hypothetical protein
MQKRYFFLALLGSFLFECSMMLNAFPESAEHFDCPIKVAYDVTGWSVGEQEDEGIIAECDSDLRTIEALEVEML